MTTITLQVMVETFHLVGIIKIIASQCGRVLHRCVTFYSIILVGLDLQQILLSKYQWNCLYVHAEQSDPTCSCGKRQF